MPPKSGVGCGPVILSKRFIDLLNAPLGVLRKVAEEHDIALKKGTPKWDIAQELAKLQRSDLEKSGYLYAGRGALIWRRFVPMNEVIKADDPDAFYPLDGHTLDAEAVRAAIRHLSEGDPFSEDERPSQITSEPKVFFAREWRGGFILRFAAAKRTSTVIHNFQSEPVLEDEFSTAWLDVANGVFEVRSGAPNADRIDRGWLFDFARELKMKVVPVAITEGDYTALLGELGASLDRYRGRDAKGVSIFGAKEFEKRDDVATLHGEAEFIDQTKDLEAVSVELLFDHNPVGEVRAHVSTRNSSIFIRNDVPEEVIRMVEDALRRVKS